MCTNMDSLFEAHFMSKQVIIECIYNAKKDY